MARYWLAAGLVLGVIALCIQGHKAPAERPEAVRIARDNGPEVATACAAKPICAADQALAAAGPACSQAIAQLAAYGMRWTTSDLFVRFPRRAWRDELPGTIKYGGESAEFESGSGNYRRVRYECDFDPKQGTVLDVRALPA